MTATKKLIIAIDGPAASGKSTTARQVARRLGYLYIDSGAMYRALTLAVLERKIDVKDKKQVIALAGDIDIRLLAGTGESRTLLDGRDVSVEIRLPEVTEVISIISAYAQVRKIMTNKQRELAKSGGVVMDGRDIGTVVLPQADIKIFMQAGIEQRTDRRFKELQAKGLNVSREVIRAEILKRDEIDSTRAVAPLKPAATAHIIDTSNLTVEEQIEKVLEIIAAVASS
jgi:cytidylate kinase